MVTGQGVPPDLVEALTARVHDTAPELDIEVVAGGQRRYLLLLGLE